MSAVPIPERRGKITVESLGPIGLFLGGLGVLGLIVMMFSGGMKGDIVPSYLFAFTFWAGITIGALTLTVLYHVVRGKWMLPTFRLLEVASSVPMLLLIAALGLPILYTVITRNPVIYQWLDPTYANGDAIVSKKLSYLNPTFWTIRFVFYFAMWILFSWWFRYSSMKQERTGDLNELVKRNNTAGFAFVLMTFSLNFAVTDWVMSADGHFSSTMYGLWAGVSFCIGAFSLVVWIANANGDREPYKSILKPMNMRDMGNILFVLTMLWAYTGLAQYLIIWSGNLPDTSFYYVERSKAGWEVVGAATIFGQFFIPFIMLLTPRNKKLTRNLAIVAAFMWFVHIIDQFQFVLPAFRHTGPMPTPFDILAFCSMGLLWIGVFGTMLKKTCLVPLFDRRMEMEDVH